jgi:acyl carrier protein
MKSVLERVRELAADVLQLPLEQITPRASPETVAGWDSVQHLNLILALEQEFDLQFEPEEIDGLSSIDRIAAALTMKLHHDE